MKHLQPEQLAALEDKYRRLLALAQDRQRWMEAGRVDVPQDARVERQKAMRELARAFPGALAELQRSSVPVLAQRLAAVTQAQQPHTDQAPWLAVVHTFHAALVDALSQKLVAPKARALEQTAAALGITVEDVRRALPWYKPGR